MAWAITRAGKAPLVALQVDADFAALKHGEVQEDQIKASARALIALALAAQNAATVVQVMASGDETSPSKGVNCCSLSILIAPMYGFLG
jgi:hypothetical protein